MDAPLTSSLSSKRELGARHKSSMTSHVHFRDLDVTTSEDDLPPSPKSPKTQRQIKVNFEKFRNNLFNAGNEGQDVLPSKSDVKTVMSRHFMDPVSLKTPSPIKNTRRLPTFSPSSDEDDISPLEPHSRPQQQHDNDTEECQRLSRFIAFKDLTVSNADTSIESSPAAKRGRPRHKPKSRPQDLAGHVEEGDEKPCEQKAERFLQYVSRLPPYYEAFDDPRALLEHYHKQFALLRKRGIDPLDILGNIEIEEKMCLECRERVVVPRDSILRKALHVHKARTLRGVCKQIIDKYVQTCRPVGYEIGPLESVLVVSWYACVMTVCKMYKMLVTLTVFYLFIKAYPDLNK